MSNPFYPRKVSYSDDGSGERNMVAASDYDALLRMWEESRIRLTENEPPPESQWVLAYDCDYDEWSEVWSDSDQCLESSAFTYWLPLPVPQKEAE